MGAASAETAAGITIFTDEACPYAERVFLTLEELGIQYKKVLVDLGNKTQEYIDLYHSVSCDPETTVRVPLFEDANGLKLVESFVIVEYLDRKYGKGGAESLLPSDPAELAKVKLFVELFTGQFVPHFYRILRSHTPENVEKHKKTLSHVLTVLNTFLTTHGSSKGGDYFLGARYSFAEVAATPHLRRMLLTLPHHRAVDPLKMAQEAGLHRLISWMQAADARPSADMVIASNERLIQAAHHISLE